MKKRVFLIITFICVLFAAILTACGEAPVKYGLSVESVRGGQLRLSEIEAAEGERITVSFESDEGWAFREGSMRINGVLTEGTSFVMPAEDVVVSGEFVLADFKGTYLYDSYIGEPDGYMYDFVDIGESTLSVGYTLATHQDNFDYVIYEDIPYEVDNYKITATVNGEAWSAEIGCGTLFHGTYEYELAENIPLGGTYTEIAEQGGNFIERDYTFTDGALAIETYDEDGTSKIERATYKQFGSFVYIELTNLYSETYRIEYGVLSMTEGGIVFKYNYHYHGGDTGVPSVTSNTLNLYSKSENKIALKEGGAYVLTQAVSPYDGSEWDIECYDFIAVQDGKLVFSRHGLYYDGSLHYFGEDTEYERFGNVLKISYSLDGNDFVLVFHIVNESTILIKSTANQVQTFTFAENSSFGGGYSSLSYGNDGETVTVTHYTDGGIYEEIYNNAGTLLEAEKTGEYTLYGSVIVYNGAISLCIGTIEEHDRTAMVGGCDYLLNVNMLYGSGRCEKSGGLALWKQLGAVC